MKEIIRYQCEHCGNHFASSKYTHTHERGCWANPKLKACRSCRFQEIKYIEEQRTVFDIAQTIIKQDGHKCVLGVGDGHNDINCPSWRYCLDFDEGDQGVE